MSHAHPANHNHANEGSWKGSFIFDGHSESGVRVTQKADSGTDNWRTFDGDKGVMGLGIYNFCGRHV